MVDYTIVSYKEKPCLVRQNFVQRIFSQIHAKLFRMRDTKRGYDMKSLHTFGKYHRVKFLTMLG